MNTEDARAFIDAPERAGWTAATIHVAIQAYAEQYAAKRLEAERERIVTLLTSAATALDSQWCEKDKNALLELAQSFRERGEPLTKSEQKYLKRIFLPTEEEKQIEVELDAVVELLEGIRTRFLYCELARDCGPLEILKTLIKDRENVYESLRVSMTD